MVFIFLFIYKDFSTLSCHVTTFDGWIFLSLPFILFFSCFHIIWYLRWLCVYCISNDQSVYTHINKSVADSLLRVCRVDFLASIVCVITKSVYPDLIPPLSFWNLGGGTNLMDMGYERTVSLRQGVMIAG